MGEPAAGGGDAGRSGVVLMRFGGRRKRWCGCGMSAVEMRPNLVIGFGGMRGARRRRLRVVSDRNRSVVGWVAVIGAVSAQDVMDRFGLGRTVGYRRLGRSSTTSSRLGPDDVTTEATPH